MRATTEECPVAVLVMSLQSIVGVVIQVYTIHNKTSDESVKLGETFEFGWKIESVLLGKSSTYC